MNNTAKVKTILANRINCSADKLTVSESRIMKDYLMVERTLTRQSPRYTEPVLAVTK
jgi:hypothetical protein